MGRIQGAITAMITPMLNGEIDEQGMIDFIDFCEAAGFDTLFIETVGVGQSETAVHGMVDFFLLIMLAGAGDELQGIKKGILEIADAIAINKADGSNIENAKKAQKDYEAAFHFLAHSSLWQPPVLTCSAVTLSGIDEIWDTILSHKRRFIASGRFFEKRKKQSISWMHSIIKEEIIENFYADPRVKESIEKFTRMVEKGDISPSAAARRILFS